MSDPVTYRYRVVDVFTGKRFEGNPLAVFPEASGLDDATMQRIARELNLSETVFAFPAAQPGHDARVRIFTPQGEAIGHIALPERCANVCFGGRYRNRLFMAASHGLYSLYVNTQGVSGG